MTTGAAPEATLRFSELEDRTAELRGSRALIARDEGGRPVGFASFRREGDT